MELLSTEMGVMIGVPHAGRIWNEVLNMLTLRLLFRCPTGDVKR